MENQRKIQQRIRQDAEERNNALLNLTCWMDSLKDDNSVLQNEKLPSNDAVPPLNLAGSYEDLRKRGNDLFAQKKYAEAVECYTRCLEFNEALATPTVYSNRAMANLKLKHYSRAEEDSTSAIRICPSHSKSLHRRALARLSLGKLRAALLDVFAAEDSCDNDNDEMKKEVEILRSKCQKALADAVQRAPRRKVQIAVV